MNSIRTLEALLRRRQIPLQQGPVVDQQPTPLPTGFDFDRIEGMMLGLAIGDSLGLLIESLTPLERRRRHGEIREHNYTQRTGHRILPSDDTQLSFWTLEHLIERQGRLEPDELGRLFASRHISGIGGSVRRFITIKKAGKPWHECGASSAGNGALMRIAPVLIPHLREPGPALWADTALAAMITHLDSASIAACVAFVHLLWELLCTEDLPPSGWTMRTWTEVSRSLELPRSVQRRMSQVS